MDKYIKLENALRTLCADCFWADGRCKEPCGRYRRFASIPDEEVEPIRWASWEILEDGSARCSSCGLIVLVVGAAGKEKDVLPRRCENCGAHIVFELKKEDDDGQA